MVCNVLRMVLRLGECELVSTGHVPYLEDTKIRSKIQSKIRRRYSTVKILCIVKDTVEDTVFAKIQ
jgi:hypothetical protein